MDNPLNFVEFIKERHTIYIKKSQNISPPWTTDIILQKYHFTNVFRELDKTSITLCSIMKDKTEHNRFISNVIIHRLLSNDVFSKKLGFITSFDSFEKMYQYHRENNLSVRTSAFMSCQSDEKFLSTCKFHWMNVFNLPRDEKSLYYTLLHRPLLGKFMAWQITQDFVMYKKVNQSHDFVVLGPGAKHGLTYIKPRIHSIFDLLNDINTELNNTIKLQLKDLEHVLCEYGKYRNIYNNTGKKRLYYNGVKNNGIA